VSDEDQPTDEPSDEHRDELPEDLDASAFVGPYVFPDNKRRRIPGYIYLGIGALCVVIWATAGDDAVLVNEGILAAGIGLLLIGGYHLLAGLPLEPLIYSNSDQSSGLSSTNALTTSPSTPSTSTRPRFVGGSSAL
jgi:hypothetical protein